MDLKISKLTKNYNFVGTLDGEILAEILQRLNLPSDYAYTVTIEGSYSVDWDDDIAMPQVDTLWAVNPQDDKMFTDLIPHVDLDVLNEQLDKFTDSHYGDWSESRMGNMIDAACDYYEDR